MYYSKLKLKNILSNNNNVLQKKKKTFQNLISTFKTESNKKYQLLLKEEKEIEKDLKKIDPEAIEEYIKDIDDWINDSKYFNNTTINNNSIILDNNITEYYKEDISGILGHFDKRKEKKIKYRTLDRLRNFKSESHFKIDSSKINDNNFNNSTKSIQNLLGNLNLKNNDNYIRLTSSQVTKKILDILDSPMDDPIQKYFDVILNDINNVNMNNNDIKNKTIKSFNPKNKLMTDEKNMINNINIFLYKMMDDSKSINLLNAKIKYINNNIINEKMGGIYLGWGESEHNEFLILKKFYQDKSNSYIFLTSLNNLFPYKTVSDLKKHIKLNEIYTKVEKIKKLLIERYTQMKNKYEIDKSRISKQTSTSVTKSCYSNKTKYNNFRKKYKMSIDFDGKNPLYCETNTKFFNKDMCKENSYVKTHYNKSCVANNNNNRIKKPKNEKLVESKKYSSMSLNNSKDKVLSSSYNMLKKGKITKHFSLNKKNEYNY
jgi:hypothetical protein